MKTDATPVAFVDVDHNLNAAVKIREVPGDSAEGPRVVETLPGQEYRSIGEPGAQVQPAVPAVTVEPDRGLHRRQMWLEIGAGVLAILVVCVGAVVAYRWHRAQRPEIRSIAVLPLVNLSGDSEQEYFSDGMTDELITSIAKATPLRVVSRTSVMRYKGTKESLGEIARELGVEAIVEGSVLRSGSRVRVTLQVVDARTAKLLWAEAYERDLHDIIALQSDIADAVSRQVATTLAPQVKSTLKRRPIPPEAYEAYLKGRYYLNRRDTADLKKSEKYFQAPSKGTQLMPPHTPG